MIIMSTRIRLERTPEQKKQHAAYMREWRKKNPELNREIHKRGNDKWLRLHKDAIYTRIAYYNRKLRYQLVAFFGAKCSNPDCLVPMGCKDQRCLEIDHINGDGFKYKNGRLRGPGEFNTVRQFLRYVQNNPEEARRRFQLLCANCHRIKTSECGEYCFKKRIDWKPPIQAE